MSSLHADMTIPMPIADSAVLDADERSVGHTLTNLSQVAIGERFIVRGIVTGGAPEWPEQLEDIGFIVGEPITLMAKGAFGGDPLVVRVGLSTFALRKAEAACVIVEPESVVLKVAA